VGSQPAPQHVLVVDDEPTIRDLLSERLVLEGYLCTAAPNAEQALAELAKQPCDVILSDLHMPGMSGLELLKEVRTRYPQAAFVMLTGENDLRVAVDAMKQGAADYLVKPFHRDAVLASVGRALERHRLELDLENYRRHLEEMVEQRTRQLHAALKRIELTYDETLEALGGALELRDLETEGHSQRVTRYALEIAKNMGCREDELKTLARGSFLHDLGKIGVPDSILLKPSRLTEQETAIMQTHVRIGYNLVSRIAFLAPAAQIVLTHQERWDGTGYPQGLRGAEIPLGARIFAVADTLDAMTSDRPYRAAQPFDVARAEIERQTDRQFDPGAVGTFISIPAEIWNKIRQDVSNGKRSSLSALLAHDAGSTALGPQAAPPPHAPKSRVVDPW
jgi:cyclic di-GMP phosphodiesterase